MTPYYDDGAGIVIYHGDCREVLPELSWDVAITDLPYAIGAEYGTYDDTPGSLDELVTDVVPSLVAQSKRCAITPGVGNMWRYPEPRWTLCWFDPGGIGSGPWGFCTWQPVLVYGADPFLANGQGRRPDGKSLMVRGGPVDGRGFMLGRRPHKEDQDGSGEHPCPKPLEVGTWLVARVSPDPSEVILDPFMGAGSFVQAARLHGHRAIGIEIEERYCEIAAKRLAQGVLDFGGAPTTRPVTDAPASLLQGGDE